MFRPFVPVTIVIALAPLSARAQESVKPSATVVFLTTASQDARTELAAAKLAMDKTQNDGVKKLAQAVQTDHEQAARQLEILAQQKNVTLPADADPMQLAAIGRLTKLEGGAFDRAYAEFMIASHTNALRDFDEAAKSTDNDVQKFAAALRPVLQRHLEAAQRLLDAIK